MTIYAVLFWIAFSANQDDWMCIEDTIEHLQRADSDGLIAAYNNTIYLFGGYNYNSQLIKFDILAQTFYDAGEQSLNFEVWGWGNFYTQIDDIVYWFYSSDSYQYDIFSYNLKNDDYNTFYAGPFEWLEGPCLASSGSGSTAYLFLVGGDDSASADKLKIYSFASQKWSPGASMQASRSSFSCIVHPRYNMLYAIGGYPDEKSVEKIAVDNIKNNAWEWVKDDLPISLQYHRSVIVGNYIITFGSSYGYDATKDVFIIDVSTDVITAPAKLSVAVRQTVPIAVDNIVYIFGGQDNNYDYLDTWQYCTVPTDAPTNIPTLSSFQSTTTSAGSTRPPSHSATNPSSSITKHLWFWVLSIGTILLLLFVTILLCCLYHKQKLPKPIIIKNPMVILLAIGDYDDEPDNSDSELLNFDLRDLDVDIDIKHMLQLFRDKLKYNVYPQYQEHPNVYWKRDDLIDFLKHHAEMFSNNVIVNGKLDENKTNFDALIMIISCHGLNKKLITSDFKLIDELVIYRMFTQYYPVSREVPRLIIVDACDGDEERKGIKKRKKSQNKQSQSSNNDVRKGSYSINQISVPAGIPRIDSEDPAVWSHSSQNPDYRLALIHATNLGFQSKMSSEYGSYFIHAFVDKTLTGIKKGIKKQPFLFETIDEIQRELGQVKQLPTSMYNHDTRYIKFVANTQSVEIEKHEEQKEEEEEKTDEDEEKQDTIDIVYNETEGKDDANEYKVEKLIELNAMEENKSDASENKHEDGSSDKIMSSSLSALKQTIKQVMHAGNTSDALSDKSQHLLTHEVDLSSI